MYSDWGDDEWLQKARVQIANSARFPKGMPEQYRLGYFDAIKMVNSVLHRVAKQSNEPTHDGPDPGDGYDWYK